MSLATWKEEFYPVEANKVSEQESLSHSLRKWIGLRPENLAKHSVSRFIGCITDGKSSLSIHSDSCALCVHYLDLVGNAKCEKCPLKQVRGEPCDRDMNGRINPYVAWKRFGDAELMIALIQKAIDAQVVAPFILAEVATWEIRDKTGKTVKTFSDHAQAVTEITLMNKAKP